MRLDEYLIEKNMAKTKSRAQNLIKMGFVCVEDVKVKKCGYKVNSNSEVALIKKDDYASLGEFKLKKALDDFNFSPQDMDCIDIGASNGGFTKALIERGAKKVYAVDVGECAFDDELKSKENIVIKDKLNARYISFDNISQKCDLIVIDVSFISIKQILPNMKQFLKNDSYIIALIKPQFETKKSNLTKKGIVKSQKVLNDIEKNIYTFIKEEGFLVLNTSGVFEYFSNKNKEWFIIMQKL